RVIVMSGVISEVNLQYALEAQSLVKDGLLEFDIATTALKNALTKRQTLQEALADLRWAPKKDATSNKLGELLVDSNMVTQAQLDGALQASFDTGMPLGGTLVIQGVLSAQLLPMVLNAQEQIRDGKISRTGAVENLKAALMFWAKADDTKDADARGDVYGASLQRGQSIQADPSYSFEATPAPPPPHRGQYEFAAEAPPHPSSQKQTPSYQAAMSPAMPSSTMGLVDMMKLAGYCNDLEINDAIQRALQNAEIASKLFMATGLLSKANYDNFVRCRALMLRGTLKPEQAIYALSADCAQLHSKMYFENLVFKFLVVNPSILRFSHFGYQINSSHKIH
ncbi:MAG: hypothetical protein K2X81_16790, partial [Candidatus Obscuribacterales bacterium]|nr:hypothetical protein [Candidatus Obscuribacterales bacterium]